MTHSFPTRRSSDLDHGGHRTAAGAGPAGTSGWLFRARTVPEYRDWYFSSGWEAGSDSTPCHIANERWWSHFCRRNRAGFSPFRLGQAGDGDGMGGMKMHHRLRSEEHTSELQSLMRISYAVFCLKKKKKKTVSKSDTK